MTKRAPRRINIALGAAVLIAASPVAAPQLLAFPYHATSHGSEVWSESPLPQRELDAVMGRATSLVAKSPIARPHESRQIFLTNGGWRWAWLATTSRGTFALTRLMGRNLVFNRNDLAGDLVFNGRAVGGERRLSSVIAHETTHGMLLRHFGPLKMVREPRWRVEGYADYVAQESALTAEEVAALESRGEQHPAIFYFKSRRRVADTLVRNGGDVDALFLGDE